MSSKTNTRTPQSNLIDNDTQYEVVPRRRSERRSENQTGVIESGVGVEGEDIKVQQLDKKQEALLREEDRRQSERRSSRPSLLSVDEIEKLRKK